jgi:hypothetical protein
MVSKTNSRRKQRFQRWGPGPLALLGYLYTTSILGKRVGIMPFLREFYPRRNYGNLAQLASRIKKWLGQLQKVGVVSEEKEPGFGGQRVWTLTLLRKRMMIVEIADILTIHLRFSPVRRLWNEPKSRLKKWDLDELVRKYKAKWPQ